MRKRNGCSLHDATTIWSTCIQPVEVLDVTREQRFREEVKAVLWPVLGLRRRGAAVDVGCGSGALTRTLARWMGPGCTVYGVDRDVNFVQFATRRAKELRLAKRTCYLQGDAFALPLPDNTADAVTSYTVVSHVSDHLRFVKEQMRVCKPGGRVSIMEVWSGAGVQADPPRAAPASAREQELWKPLEKVGRRHIDEPWAVGKLSVGPYDVVRIFERAGLQEIMVDAFCTVNALDDARVSLEAAEQRVTAEERMILGNIDKLAPLLDNPLPRQHLTELRRRIRARFGKRRSYLRSKTRIWDCSVGVSVVVSGRAP